MFAKTRLEDKSLEWLRQLMEWDGARFGLPVADIMQAAKRAGFTRREIKQARHHLGIVSEYNAKRETQVWRKSNARKRH